MPTSPAAPTPPARPWHGVGHYENFPVASWLVPRARRPAVVALYQFARYADDVADEGDAPAVERLRELAALDQALDGRGPAHPRVSPLLAHLHGQSEAIADCRSLLSAFRQDVTVHRHPDFPHLRDYCSRSADPVGRLMLGLFDCRRPELLAYSDAICTGLQLLNFIQDLALDWNRGRLYLPLDELAAHDLREADLDRAARLAQAPSPLRALLALQTGRAAQWLEAGAPLVTAVPWRLGLELRAVLGGARRIVEQLERDGHDPFRRRPCLRAADTLAVLRLACRRVAPAS